MKKTIKKLLVLVLTMTLFVCSFPLSSFADTATAVETVGLEEVKVSANYVYLRIKVLDDAVAVFSNPCDSGYYISSSTLLSALKSNNGYTLSYTLEEGGDDVNVSHVVGGYIKASKAEADDVYIPVVNKADYTDAIDLTQSESLWTESGSESVSASSVSSVGGKPSDDYSKKVEVSTEGLSGYYLLNLEGTKDSENNDNVKGWVDNYDTTFTYVFNIYAEDVSAPVIYANSAHGSVKNYVLARFDSEGYLSYTKTAYSGGTTSDVKTQYKLTPNSWHQIAISFCSARWRPLIFFDGKYVGCTDSHYDWQVYQFAIGVDKSKQGTVYFDDVEYYEGYYDSDYVNKASKLNLSSGSESVHIASDGNINVDLSVINSADSLFSVLSTDADNIKLYADNSFSAEASEVADGNVLVLSDVDNKIFKYYNVSPIEFKMKSTEKIATATPDVYNISATLEYNASRGNDATMILIISGSDGRFEKIICSETKNVIGEETFTISDVNTSGKKIEMFFLDNWNNYIPYFAKQIVE